MNHSEQTAGAAVGGTLGFIKGMMVMTHISWALLMDTAILAAVGALVGYLVTGLLKWLKKKLID
jgi:hypothetical protein